MKYLIKILLLLILNLIFCQSYDLNTFEDYYAVVNQLEKNGEYDSAIELTKNIWNHFPDKRFEIMKELEYLNKKTNQYIKNLNLWQNGHQQGYFFLLNKQMKQYEPYLQYSMFDSLVINDRNLREEALDSSKSQYEVFLPIKYYISQKYPLLIVLHGGGSNIEKAKKRWKLTDRLKSDFIVVFIQSYRHYDSNTFGWSSSDTRAYNDIEAIFSEIKSLYSIDTSKVIMGGTSAGGTMALDIAFKNIIPTSSLILFCPGKPKDFEKIHNLIENIKVYMLSGKGDYYIPKQEEMIKIFSKEGVCYRYKRIPGMGHEFPSQYNLIIDDALNYLFN